MCCTFWAASTVHTASASGEGHLPFCKKHASARALRQSTSSLTQENHGRMKSVSMPGSNHTSTSDWNLKRGKGDKTGSALIDRSQAVRTRSVFSDYLMETMRAEQQGEYALFSASATVI